MDEVALVRAAQNGDLDSFNRLVLAYQEMAFNVAYRMLSDERGSVRLVVNIADGSVAQQLDYDEFGRVLLDTAPGFQPFGFAGGLYDPDSGLVRFGERDYSPETGQWTARDPIDFDGGQLSLYAYVGNDPLNSTDTAGTQNTVIGGNMGGLWNFPLPPSNKNSVVDFRKQLDQKHKEAERKDCRYFQNEEDIKELKVLAKNAKQLKDWNRNMDPLIRERQEVRKRLESELRNSLH